MHRRRSTGHLRGILVKCIVFTASHRCVFRADTLEAAFRAGGASACPHCRTPYPLPSPAQPRATMTVRVDPRSAVGGAPAARGGGGGGVIVVEYEARSGTQTDAHETPGAPFKGTGRVCYYPHDARGREAVALLRRAFALGRVFKVGTSVTTGAPGQTVWAGIHHKTNLEGGPANHGYPDAQFLERLKTECMAHGIA